MANPVAVDGSRANPWHDRHGSGRHASRSGVGLLAFREAGISQFILSGWPKQQEMLRFAKEVLPLLHTEEQR